VAWGAAALAVGATALFALPRPVPNPAAGADSLRVATYNIHYGYNSRWRYSLEEQARAIERSGADVVFLQEVDAGRITSYGVDNALWLGRRLGMEHVFGPALEDLSGVALLSRYPVRESATQHLESQLEQTAIVHAQVLLSDGEAEGEGADGGTAIHAYGTWLGLEPDERARQLEDALAIIGDTSPAVLGGDFNARPGSPTYRTLQAAGFEDPFTVLGRDPTGTSPALDPVERIDFVLARGLDTIDATVLNALASDHRLVVASFERP
jgi:endonuclease/exonuclease/phosphatase family metal-dependent hydrolase